MSDASNPMEGTPLIPPSSTDHSLYETVVEGCRTVYDREIPVNIYDLGLIYTNESFGELDYKEGIKWYKEAAEKKLVILVFHYLN